MQQFTCPFCGPRDETEFHFGADAGKLRPEGADVSAEVWADYLYGTENRKGETLEIWMHLICGEFFKLRRDTVTHRVLAAMPLHAESSR